MVRDPSIVSPSLTGVFIGGGHNKHGTGSGCTLPRQYRPPLPDGRRWRCDRSSYKRSLFSRIRDGQAHYLTGPETAETPPSPSRIHVGSNHSGMGKPINFHCVSPLHLQGIAGEGLAVSGTGSQSLAGSRCNLHATSRSSHSRRSPSRRYLLCRVALVCLILRRRRRLPIPCSRGFSSLSAQLCPPRGIFWPLEFIELSTSPRARTTLLTPTAIICR